METQKPLQLKVGIKKMTETRKWQAVKIKIQKEDCVEDQAAWFRYVSLRFTGALHAGIYWVMSFLCPLPRDTQVR